MAGLPDVLVVGGGIIGLACAWALADRGAQVTVLERGQPGDGASGAAAGMLAAHHESGGDPAFLDLARRSLALWPDFAAALREESGIDPEWVPSGVLSLATDSGTAAAMQAAAAGDLRWWDAATVAGQIPGVQGALGGLYAVREGHVQPPRAVQALAAACARRGVQVRTGVEVLALEIAGGRCTGVRTAAGRLPAGAVLLAAGAWSGALAARSGLSLPVFPVRGQILQLMPGSAAAGPWRVACLPVFGPGVYLVPKRDGRLIAGATMEPEAGFDCRVTLGGLLTLTGAAAALLPALTAAPVAATWAGLRPGSPDGLPCIGPVPDLSGLWLATGHGRNGVLLAPVTAELVAASLAGGAPVPPAVAPARLPASSPAR